MTIQRIDLEGKDEMTKMTLLGNASLGMVKVLEVAP